nr:proteasome subunit beta type-4 [Tanacetum cinerariifolium]
PLKINYSNPLLPIITSRSSSSIVYPYVTGAYIIGIKYKDSILLAADMGEYGLVQS